MVAQRRPAGRMLMIEFAATFIAVGGAIAASVAAGTHYLDSHSQFDLSAKQSKDKPLVRPQYPSGGEWPDSAS